MDNSSGNQVCCKTALELCPSGANECCADMGCEDRGSGSRCCKFEGDACAVAAECCTRHACLHNGVDGVSCCGLADQHCDFVGQDRGCCGSLRCLSGQVCG
ncbi:MAG: hypothetical protein H0U10_06115 [Chloroflexia bacterium]|nr:hypothetical protein [Chloroflexia bacterium]